MATWLGTTVEAMDRDHDPLHHALCAWLGITSQSMRVAAGERLTEQEHELAGYEEEAVLYLQRYLGHAGGEVPVVGK